MERQTLKRDIAVVRVLLDEIDRAGDFDDGIALQLMNEVERVLTALTKPPGPHLAKCQHDEAHECDAHATVSMPSRTRSCS